MALHQLGRTKPPKDAIDALLECHVRIRHYVGLIGRLAEAADEEPSEVAAVATSIVHYLTDALPLHAADEDDSLLPRLRGKDRRIDAELERMHRDHVEHGYVIDPVIRFCTQLGEDPGQVGQLGPRLGFAAVNLASHFAGHLRREEEILFPAARKYLTEAELAAIWDEIRGRRGES